MTSASGEKAVGTKYKTDDLRILEIKEVSPPDVVHAEFPITGGNHCRHPQCDSPHPSRRG